MKKPRLISIFCAMVMVLGCFGGLSAAAEQPSWVLAENGGTGTATDPYILNSTNFSAWVADSASYMDKCYKLTSDIDLNTNWTAGKTPPTANVWTTPIGNTATFSGTFDGNGHSVSGIYLKTSGRSSLFYNVSGTVKNLKIVNSYFECTATTGSVECASVTACLTEGTVLNCYSDAILVNQSATAVNSAFSIGGIVGFVNIDGTIESCVFAGTVDGIGNSGGILGKVAWDASAAYKATISNCLNIGSVKTIGDRCGAIIGHLNDQKVSIIGCMNLSDDLVDANGSPSEIVGGGYKTVATVSDFVAVNGLRTSKEYLASGSVASKCAAWDVSEISIDTLLSEEVTQTGGALEGWTYVDGYLPVPTTAELNVRIDDNYVAENVRLGLNFKGAAVRIEDVSGIRFATDVDADVLTALKSGATVRFGTYITLADFVTGDNAVEFTPEKLSAAGYECLDVYADELRDGDHIAGTVAYVKDNAREYASRAYVKITMDRVEYTYLADFSEDNVRSVAKVAQDALDDLKSEDEKNDVYKYAVDVDGVTMYSRYDSDQRATLQGLAAVSI